MTLKESILATLTYHDIFDYPLKIEEVAVLSIANRASLKEIKKTLDSLISESLIGEHKKFYYLFKKRNLVQTRLTRAKHSQKKLKKSLLYAKILKLNPLIQMVGISGALAMENSHKLDDIDLVVITKANLLWTARLFTNALLFPVKRKPGTKFSNNRACLNLFLDASDLKIKDENIYQAHEICQLKPLWQRNNAYYNFINANRWVKKYLPNWSPKTNLVGGGKAGKAESRESKVGSRRVNREFSTFNFAKQNMFFPLSILEMSLKKLQLGYMHSRITTERIGDTQLFFHPANSQEWVLKEYNKRLKNLNILR